MLGVRINELSHAFCDNVSVVCNMTEPESTLKKKRNAIACHCVREAVAMKEILIACKPADINLSELMMKARPGRQQGERLVREVLCDI
jgi:hypothetical protein